MRAPPVSETAVAYLRDSVARPPFHQWLQPTVAAFDEASGEVTITLALRPEFRRDPERPEIHGGVIAALVDIAGHATVAGRLRHGVPTVDMRIDYLRMAAGDTLHATGIPIKLGRSLALVDVRIADEKGKLVAAGRCTFSTLDR